MTAEKDACSSLIAPVVLDGVNTTALPSDQFQNFTASTKSCYVEVYTVKVDNCQGRKKEVQI